MKFCSKCGAQCDDNAVFCASCGTSFDPTKQAPVTPAAPAYNYDHTAEFDAKEVSEGKVYAMLCYLMGVIGIIIALLASSKSEYLRFHVRQAVKLSVTQILLGICTVLLVWTLFVDFIFGTICMLIPLVCLGIVSVLQIIAFFQICCGKSKEPAIVRSLPFLK